MWPIQGCAAGQGMVFDLSVLKRVYNFEQVSCPKRGQGFKSSAVHLYPNTGPVSPPGLRQRAN